jgi:tetratricopeptide (TPR) repeat protein
MAWAKLALVYSWQGIDGELTAAEAEKAGGEAANRALAIDPNCVDAYYARGNIYRVVAADWAAAKSDYDRAVAIDPHQPSWALTDFLTSPRKLFAHQLCCEYSVQQYRVGATKCSTSPHCVHHAIMPRIPYSTGGTPENKCQQRYLDRQSQHQQPIWHATE